MNITIKCPNCGVDHVVASAVGIEKKSFKCQHCGETKLAKDYLPKYSLKMEGKNYQLHFGRQKVGRKSSQNDADIQIPDETRYMSRFHAIIELRCTANGVECTFEEHGKNPTILEHVKLIKNDIVYLNVNDCLTMGSKKMYLAGEFDNTTVKQK